LGKGRGEEREEDFKLYFNLEGLGPRFNITYLEGRGHYFLRD